MSNSSNQDLTGEDKIEDLERANQYGDEDSEESLSIDARYSCGVGSGASSSGSRDSGGSRTETGLTDRLTDVLVYGGDGDLLLQQSDREDGVLQLLRALDMQVIGACRADERLKPLLKVNASNSVAEDCLLAHLSGHFEPAEVGMLARCFCMPLVSLRVGKICKQGTLLFPTATRGNLNLTVLPTSDLRLSFIGDNGETQRLFTVSSKSQCALVTVDEISADNSGRSFLIKIPDGQVVYFWCSEKSELLGVELLVKMKDLLKRKPSIAELCGICESRLSCFATHLRAYLAATVGSSQPSSPGSPIPPLKTTTELSDTSQGGRSLMSFKSLRSRHIGSQSVKANSFHPGSLSPRISSFKEGQPRNLSSLRSAGRENLRQRGDGRLSSVENLTITLSTGIDASSSNNSENDITRNLPFSSASLLESLGKLAVAPALYLTTQVSCVGLPLFSPYYCHCTPGMSTPQFSAAPQQLPASSNESQSLPHLSSLVPVTMPSSLLTSKQPLSLGEASTVNFPTFQPDPLFQLPTQTSHQILPTFIPLMCDPIVHTPFIGVCSSGQGYLVSAGPTISTAIHPLHPKLVNPLMPETDSILEKGARETLRLLISGSSRTNLPLMDVFPAVLTKADQNQSVLAAGSQGLYSGTTDAGVIGTSIAAMSLASLSERSDRDSYDNTDIHPATSCGSVGYCSVDKGSTSCSDWMEESD